MPEPTEHSTQFDAPVAKIMRFVTKKFHGDEYHLLGVDSSDPVDGLTIEQYIRYLLKQQYDQGHRDGYYKGFDDGFEEGL